MGLTARNSRSLGALATWSRWGHSGEDLGWLLAGPGLEGASTQGNPRPGQPRRERVDPCVSFRGRTVSGSHQRGATLTHFYRCIKHTLTYSVHFQLIHHRPTHVSPSLLSWGRNPLHPAHEENTGQRPKEGWQSFNKLNTVFKLC